MFIVYVGNNEVLVTTKKREKKTLKRWFPLESGRDVRDYDRKEIDEECISIRCNKPDEKFEVV